MNKQLIITYFEEFKHWLNGGKLQAKFVYDQWEEAPKDAVLCNYKKFSIKLFKEVE